MTLGIPVRPSAPPVMLRLTAARRTTSPKARVAMARKTPRSRSTGKPMISPTIPAATGPARKRNRVRELEVQTQDPGRVAPYGRESRIAQGEHARRKGDVQAQGQQGIDADEVYHAAVYGVELGEDTPSAFRPPLFSRGPKDRMDGPEESRREPRRLRRPADWTYP